MSRPDNDNLARLPMFASDREIAVALVGKGRADYWIRSVLPTLRGFPPIDALHDGRPVALVRKFYDGYLGIVEEFNSKGASGQENWDAWKKPRKKAA